MEQNFIVIDGSMAELIRPSLYDAYQVSISKSFPSCRILIHGPPPPPKKKKSVLKCCSMSNCLLSSYVILFSLATLLFEKA